MVDVVFGGKRRKNLTGADGRPICLIVMVTNGPCSLGVLEEALLRAGSG